MGKVIATWLVKVVAREPDEPDPDAAERDTPTNAQVEEAVASAVTALGEGGFAVNATAERTDI